MTGFRPGALDRLIALRGLSHEGLAAAAGIDRNTVTRACRGDRLTHRTIKKIVAGLVSHPELPGLAELLEVSA